MFKIVLDARQSRLIQNKKLLKDALGDGVYVEQPILEHQPRRNRRDGAA